MKKTMIIICFLFLYVNISLAQERNSKGLLYGDLSYGFENNMGNPGTLMGVGYQRNLSRKFIFQTDIHYFTTKIIDSKWAEQKQINEERFYNAAFLSVGLGYAVIGKTDQFNITIKGGFSLCHLYSEDFFKLGYTQLVNGVMVNVPTFQAFYENRTVGAYNLGLDVNIPTYQNQFLTIGFLSYSHDIPLQFLFFPLPVISYKVRL